MISKLKKIIEASPLPADQKQFLIQKLESEKDIDDVTIIFQQLLALYAQEIAHDISQLNDPSLKDIQSMLKQDIQQANTRMLNTLQRLKADSEDFNLDAKQNKLDLKIAIEETAKLSAKE